MRTTRVGPLVVAAIFCFYIGARVEACADAGGGATGVGTAKLFLTDQSAGILLGTPTDTTLSRGTGGGLQTPGAFEVGGKLIADAAALGTLTVIGSSALLNVTVSNLTLAIAAVNALSTTSVGVSGGLVVNGTSSLGAVLATGVTVAATGGSTLLGTTTCGSSGAPGAFTAWGTAQLKSSVQIGGTLSVTGAATLSSALAVTGTTTLSALSVTGPTNFGGTLTVSGRLTAAQVTADDTATIGVLTVAGTASVANGLYIPALIRVQSIGSASVPVPPGSVAIPFDTDLINRGGFYVTDGNTRFHPYVSGVYDVCTSVWWGTFPTAGTDLQLFMRTPNESEVWVTPASQISPHTDMCGPIFIAANDWVEVRAWIAVGSNSVRDYRRRISITLVSAHDLTAEEQHAFELTKQPSAQETTAASSAGP